jgi:ATP-binding cassette subfamily B protein
MTPQTPAQDALIKDLDEVWQLPLQKQLHAGENVLATLSVDLDERLRFGQGLLAITNQRVLSCQPGADPGAWQAWAMSPELSLTHHDHAGVGHLALCNPSGRLAHWCFTLGHNLQALRVAEQFRAQQEHRSGFEPMVGAAGVCPSCKSPLDPDADVCPICTKVIHTPPSTWTLLRLWRFAKPYKTQLISSSGGSC